MEKDTPFLNCTNRPHSPLSRLLAVDEDHNIESRVLFVYGYIRYTELSDHSLLWFLIQYENQMTFRAKAPGSQAVRLSPKLSHIFFSSAFICKVDDPS